MSASAEKWIVYWHGSGPQRGSHIMRLRPCGYGYDGEIAYLGAESHELADEIVRLHNQE